MDKFAVQFLYESVRARFEADGDDVPFYFGWKAPDRKGPQTRIVFVPGDDSTDDVGEYQRVRDPGKELRTLAEMSEFFTVYLRTEALCGVESEQDDELNQYAAARLLHDKFVRACVLVAQGTFQFTRPKYYGDPKERRRGLTIRIVGRIDAPIIDDISHVIARPTSAKADVSELDIKEKITTEIT